MCMNVSISVVNKLIRKHVLMSHTNFRSAMSEIDDFCENFVGKQVALIPLENTW